MNLEFRRIFLRHFPYVKLVTEQVLGLLSSFSVGQLDTTRTEVHELRTKGQHTTIKFNSLRTDVTARLERLSVRINDLEAARSLNLDNPVQQLPTGENAIVLVQPPRNTGPCTPNTHLARNEPPVEHVRHDLDLNQICSVISN